MPVGDGPFRNQIATIVLDPEASMGATLQRCAEAIVEALGAAFARIWVLDDSGDVLVLRASAGLYRHLDGSHARMPVGQSQIGRIAASRRPHLTNDLLRDPSVDTAWAREVGVTSFAGYPMLSNRGLVGVVAVFGYAPFEPTALDALSAVAVTMAERIERARAESSLAESEERFRATFEQAAVGMAIVGLDGSWLYVNRRLCDMLGYTEHELRTRRFHDVTHPDDLLSDVVLADRMFRGDIPTYTLEKRYVRKDGSSFWIKLTASVVRNVEGAPRYGIAVIEDIDEQRHARETLRQTHQLLETVVDASPIAIIALDERDRVLLWNSTATRLFGWEATEVLGRPYPLIPDDQRAEYETLRQRTIAGESLIAGHLRRQKKDGSLLETTVSTAPLLDDSGRVTGRLALLTDVSEQRRMELQLRQAEKVDAIGHLAAGIAHDFNNMLSIVIGYAELIEQDSDTDDPRLEGIRAIRSAGEVAARLTRQLLLFSRTQVTRPRVVNVAEVVAEFEQLLRAALPASIVLSAQLDADAPTVLLDPSQLEQMLLNLVVNARDAMPTGGRVTMRVASGMDPAGRERSPRAGTVVTVTDTGRGMSPEVKARALDMFFTTKPVGKGTGLGLATVQRIVASAGGQITIASEVGRGTTIAIWLPAHAAERGEHGVDLKMRPAAGRRARILLVEDEPELTRLWTRTLAGAGHTVADASTAAAALEALRSGAVDVIVTDVVLPDRSGIDLVAQARQLHANVPVLFVSGYAQRAEELQSLLDERTAFLQKPLSPLVLLSQVAALVGARQ